jgi:hypothetical protein
MYSDTKDFEEWTASIFLAEVTLVMIQLGYIVFYKDGGQSDQLEGKEGQAPVWATSSGSEYFHKKALEPDMNGSKCKAIWKWSKFK